MGSLIDEAIADEQAFREKTADLFERAGWSRVANRIARGDAPKGMFGVDCIRDRIGRSMRDGSEIKGLGPELLDIEALRHAEALDAALWAKEQLGR